MQFLLVENRTTVLLGPLHWKPRFIQSELDDLEIDFKVPPKNEGYLRINDNIEIIPVGSSHMPAIDSTFEALVGPFYSYENGLAHQTYNTRQLDIEHIKHNLKEMAAEIRYNYEIKGTTVLLNDTEVKIETDRFSRGQFNGLFATIGNSTVNWKFNKQFLTIGIGEVKQILLSINTHVSEQFDWEKEIWDKIDQTNTVEQLTEIKTIIENKKANLKIS